MSFILKALKKLENEKAAHQPGKVEISSALLAPDRRSVLSSRAKIFWIVLSMLFVAVAGIFLFPQDKGPLPSSKTKTQTANPIQQPRSIPATPTVAREEKPALPVATAIREETLPQEKTVSRPVESMPKAQVRLKHRSRERSNEELDAEERPAEAGNQLAAAPSSLVVNGIALQDDPSKSIAVVNGQILKRGMSIGDAKVDRIFLDKVRFRGSSGVFEVQLSK